jgi:hypothetical protein
MLVADGRPSACGSTAVPTAIKVRHFMMRPGRAIEPEKTNA